VGSRIPKGADLYPCEARYELGRRDLQVPGLDAAKAVGRLYQEANVACARRVRTPLLAHVIIQWRKSQAAVQAVAQAGSLLNGRRRP
jgi:hypothetical protein